MTPKLADGVKITGDILVRLVGQGCIYVRTLLPVTDEDADDEEDMDLIVDPFAQDEKIEETSGGSVSSTIEQPGVIVSGLSSENVLGAEVEVIVDGSVNEQPNFTETSTGFNGEISPSADVQVIDTVPVGDVLQDEVQIDEPVKCIRVHRVSVREDMLDIFAYQRIIFAPLQVTLVNTFGRDEEGLGSGPSREVFALFWKEAYNSLLLGERERVPYIRHDYTREKWEAIARILVKGFTEVSYFPFMFSKPFLVSCLYGEKKRMLIDSFMLYVSRDEASLINKALAHEASLDEEEFMDFLTNFDCKRRVTELNLREIIHELAHKELIQKPQYVINCWKPILSQLKCYFPNPEALFSHYKVVIPTTSKVIGLLQTDPSMPAEMETFSNFKRYIRGLDSTKLGAFLRFCTGSDTLVTDRIDIAFTQSAGVGRVPVGHTCGFKLELPSTYENLCAMREEFKNILSADNWEMNFV